MFKNKYIEEKVREKLEIAETALTTEDLEVINGFIIIGDIVEQGTATGSSGEEWTIIPVPIPWFMDSTAFKMRLPKVTLNYNEMLLHGGWEEDLRLFMHIETLCCYSPIPLDLIGSFTKLTNLTLQEMEISDWSFLAGLNDLCMIHLYKCGKNGNDVIKYIGEIHAKQRAIFKQVRAEGVKDCLLCNVLDNIAVIKMNVSDLSPFANARFTELDLSWNAISEISALSETRAYCLTLSHNNIENIQALNLNNYMLNLRHNKIKTIKPIIERSNNLPARLYIEHNEFPDDERVGFNKHDFVDDDFIRDDLTNNVSREYWRIEKAAYKNGRPRLDKSYPEIVGTILTDVNIDVAARWNFVADKHGYPSSGGWWRTSRVNNVTLKNGVMRISTKNTIYTLRQVSEEEVRGL
jgi:hypothetical protein